MVFWIEEDIQGHPTLLPSHKTNEDGSIERNMFCFIIIIII